jgi:hypothetical protein
VGREGLRVNPKKVQAAQDFPRPTNEKGIKSFLGLVGYFRTFVQDFASKAKPLHELTRKDVEFVWTKTHEQSFKALKESLLKAPVLAFPNFQQEFLLTTDASGYAIGSILTQIDQETSKEKLILCHSRSLKGAEMRYCNFDREILAVLYGVQQNRSYLWGCPFII